MLEAVVVEDEVTNWLKAYGHILDDVITKPLEEFEIRRRLAEDFFWAERDVENEHVDNRRVCEIGNWHAGQALTQEQYITRKLGGCCGRVDRIVMIGDRMFLIGFNYGH